MHLSSAYLPPSEGVSVSPPARFFEPPREMVESFWDWGHLDRVATGRLIASLREAARARNSTNALVRAVASRIMASRRGASMVEGTALADLAVSGRRAFEEFRSSPPTNETLLRAVNDALRAGLPPGLAASRPEIETAVARTLDRAYSVVWALRGSPGHRARLRPGLGWIAVSSEDDPAHTPTNVECTSDAMGEISVPVDDLGVVLSMRAAIKVPDELPDEPIPASPLRTLPRARFSELLSTSRERHYDKLVLFIHGLGSSLEESDDFKRRLIEHGRRRGRRYAVLSIDLPGAGYSSRLNLDGLLRARVRGHHGFQLPDGRGSNFPLLGLYRDVLTLLSRRISGGYQFVCGGSLGGNMVLWLAAVPMFSGLRGAAAEVGAARYASWSPGSIWESYERSRDTPFEGNGTHMDIGKNGAKKRSQERMREIENSGSRFRFFELMQRGEHVLLGFRTGAWGFPPRRAGLLKQSELYGPEYRRTFWMLAYEQVVFSYQEPLNRGRWPFLTITRPLLLASGEKDKGSSGVMNIYDQVVKVTEHASSVPGRRLLMKETGHSISDERPKHLASEVMNFFIAGE